MTPKSVLRPVSIATLLRLWAVCGGGVSLIGAGALAERAVAISPAFSQAASTEAASEASETTASGGASPSAAAGSAPRTGLTVVPPTAEQAARYRDRLARNFAQRTRNLLQREYIFLGMLESGKSMLDVALELAPESPFLWRLALDYAVTLEDGSPEAAELAQRALARLGQLEPQDELIRLRRLLVLVEQRQTAEARIALYRQLLAPESVERIGSSVAARLAFDLALLLRQTGDQPGFERELIHSLNLDPFFPEATEFAAGYFRTSAPDAASEARALRQALLANPTREPAALRLAELCLSSGAYRAAADVLAVVAELLQTNLPDLDFDAVLTDLCLAQWGSDRIEPALAIGTKRQDDLNRVFRQTIERQGTTLSVEDLRNLAYPMSMPLATTFAALANSVAPEESGNVLKGVRVSTETTLRAMDEQSAGADEKAATALQGAFVQLWLGGDIDFAKAQVDAATTFAPLSEAARARFDGWFALRANDLAKARELFTPFAATDTGAQLGLAVADAALGDQKAAARGFLAVARANPASAIGLWSRDRLRKIVGQDIQVVEKAEAVEEAAKLPPEFLSLLKSSAGRLMLRIYPRETNISAWDPMVFDVEISNRSDWPLAISPDGPLADTATVTANVNVPGQPATAPPFALLAINRRFAIQPGESLRVPLDVSLTDASFAMREDALSGGFVSIHPILNWRTTERGLEPGPLGVEAESPLVHVRGERVSLPWIEESIQSLRDTTKTPDPERIAALAAVLVRASKDPTRYTPAERQALEPLPQLLADAAQRLWPEARAWLIFAIPKGELRELAVRASELEGQNALGQPREAIPTDGTQPSGAGAPSASGAADPAETMKVVGLENVSAAPTLAPLDAVLASDEHPLVRMAWIAVRVKRPEDQLLAKTFEHPDPRIARFARDFAAWMNDVQDERRRKLNLSK